MTAEDLIKQFELPFADFSEPIKWQDELGFSTTQSYGNGYGSLYKFGVYDKTDKNGLRNLSVSVSYGKESSGGISVGTGTKGIWDPIDLFFRDQFTFNETQEKFYCQGEEINAKELLLKVEKMHKKPTKFIGGFLLRTRLWFWRKFVPALIKVLDLLLISILYIISGEKVKKDILKRYFSEKYDEKSNQRMKTEFEYEESKTIDFFGYKAKRWSVVFYCLLHLIIYLFFFYLPNHHHSLASAVGKDNFLSICYVVVSFTITESLVPKAIKSLISKTPKFFTEIAFRSLKLNIS